MSRSHIGYSISVTTSSDRAVLAQTAHSSCPRRSRFLGGFINSKRYSVDMSITIIYEDRRSEINISVHGEPDSTAEAMNVLYELEFSNSDIELMYNSLRSSFLKNRSSVVSIPAALDVYEQLKQSMDVESVKKIEIDDSFDRRYAPIIKDFADENNINTNISINNRRQQVVLASLPSFALGVLAQFYWATHNQFRDPPEGADTVFFYGPGRFPNKSSILEEAQGCDKIDSLFVSRAIKPTRFLPDEVQDHNPVSLGRFTKLTDISSTLELFLYSVLPEMLIHNTIENKLTEAMHETFQAYLPTTIKSHCTYAYRDLDFYVFAKYTSACAVIKRTGCKNVVVGSMSVLTKAIAFGAHQCGVSVYHTPNGVINENIWNPKYTHFVSGRSAQSYIEQQMKIEDASTFVPTGRPNLSSLYNEYGDYSEFPTNEEDLCIVIATQPYSDDERRKFAEGCLAAIEGIQKPINTIIKIHPAEDPTFYESIANDSVCVSDGDLFTHLESAHLVIVPNSNVALESIIIGTPALVYQPFPSILKPDINEGPIPVYIDDTAMRKWFSGLTASEHRDLWQKQIEYIKTHHRLDPDPEKKIIDEIDDS